MINAKRISDILFDCFVGEDHVKEENGNRFPDINTVVQKGVVRTFVFDPDKLKEYEVEIKENLDQIYNLDQGISFIALGICKDAEDKSGYSGWGEQIEFEQLMALGEAIGWVARPFPDEISHVLPGDVPYFQLLKEKKEMKIITPEEYKEKYCK